MGLSGEEVERVIAGSAAAGWQPHESAILRAVEELHVDARVGSRNLGAAGGALSTRRN